MRKLLIITAFAAFPWCVSAQVDKQVEVTKAYVPSVEDAQKLAIVPDMADTAQMRPEIDYTITPLSLRTTLETRPIRPAKVTYWEFNRPLPFYLKAGAGYPLNSVLDFYASSQNPGTGYVVGYVNHEGRYAKIPNDFGVRNNSTRMLNRVGAAAGKYLGRHLLEGDVSYENRLYHRYGLYYADGWEPDIWPGEAVDYSDVKIDLRFGDDFQDLSRVNFEVALHGGLFFDHSNWIDYNDKARQSTLGASAKIAKGFGRHRLSAEVGYERMAGQKVLDTCRESLIHAALRYGVDGGTVRFEAGADYYHDRILGAETGNYIIPFLRLNFNLGTPGIQPFVELDGGVHENTFRALTLQNPYIASPAGFGALGMQLPGKSSVDYNGRFGLGGSIWRDRFTYRVYAGFSILDNHIYWYGKSLRDPATDAFVMTPVALIPAQGRQTVTSICGQIEFRPVSALQFSLGVYGYLYNDDTHYFNGSPSFRGNLGLRYEGRKIAFGVRANVQSTRKWSVVDSSNPELGDAYEVPFAVDLRADFEWRVSGGLALFAEGQNLVNQRLYEFPWYPGDGVGFTVGIKANF